jgi:hypothetical protein
MAGAYVRGRRGRGGAHAVPSVTGLATPPPSWSGWVRYMRGGRGRDGPPHFIRDQTGNPGGLPVLAGTAYARGGGCGASHPTTFHPRPNWQPDPPGARRYVRGAAAVTWRANPQPHPRPGPGRDGYVRGGRGGGVPPRFSPDRSRNPTLPWGHQRPWAWSAAKQRIPLACLSLEGGYGRLFIALGQE